MKSEPLKWIHQHVWINSSRVGGLSLLRPENRLRHSRILRAWRDRSKTRLDLRERRTFNNFGKMFSLRINYEPIFNMYFFPGWAIIELYSGLLRKSFSQLGCTGGFVSWREFLTDWWWECNQSGSQRVPFYESITRSQNACLANEMSISRSAWNV